jgi:hypothetical protein
MLLLIHFLLPLVIILLACLVQAGQRALPEQLVLQDLPEQLVLQDLPEQLVQVVLTVLVLP